MIFMHFLRFKDGYREQETSSLEIQAEMPQRNKKTEKTPESLWDVQPLD